MSKYFISLFVLVGMSFQVVHADLFVDDFDDGDLVGWTAKQGSWTNPGDHLLSSYDNYGVIWKDDSFGFNQSIQVDAYFDDGGTSKSAELRLRSGEGGGGNSFFDHGYHANVQCNYLGIINTVGPGDHRVLGQLSLTGILPQNDWATIVFSVSGSGEDTYLELWINDVLKLYVFDNMGAQHDDGGYLALGSSNHINRRIKYDNFVGCVDVTPVPTPTAVLLGFLGLGTAAARLRRRRELKQ